MEDLKPCPFCGAPQDHAPLFMTNQGDKWGFVYCGCCEAGGPQVRTNYNFKENAPWHAAAITYWNKREEAK